ncbi:dihydrolipoamide dehydrogenase [Tenacibaculum todarodis]|uniref:Dihydrolipoamide dehydrogenase n=1 Tax=Tenacibaculum todarodis TaxID=1850252 RepID=A0A1L3JMR1_9FLAO|nr:dihydrolipoamide dehydrogenase [Tenacibaculum todarodis]
MSAPAPSPFSTLKQKVGLTDVTLEYSRPSMKGRTIFGDLVPYGKTWRTGANANTKITFSTDVTIGEKNVAAGTYAVYTKPNEKSWDIMLYSDSDNWGNPKEWDAAKVVASTNVEVQKMPMKIETFTATFDDLTNNNGVLGLLWEDVYVGMPFTVPTEKLVMASIDEVMKGEPNASAFYDAAVYYKTADKDINQALTWVDKAIEMTKEDPKFWMLRQQSLIHAKAGKTATAIAAAKQSLELAEKVGNEGYVKMNKASLEEWGAK